MTAEHVGQFIGLLAALLLLPPFVERFTKLPQALTVISMGVVAGPIGFGIIGQTETIIILSTVGIISIFLHAGLDVELRAFRASWRETLESLLLVICLTAGIGYALFSFLGASATVSTLLATALVIPSASIILHGIASYGLQQEDAKWVKLTTITLEVSGLLAVFVLLNLHDLRTFYVGLAALIGAITFTPLIFRLLHSLVFVHTKGAEFPAVFLLALLAGYLTETIGVHYMFGSFFVGVILMWSIERARRLEIGGIPLLEEQEGLRAEFNKEKEGLLNTVGQFTRLFGPFFFFNVGLTLPGEAFSFGAAGLGAGAFVIVTLLRVMLSAVHRKIHHKEAWDNAVTMALLLSPTLVFTLVLAQLMLDAGFITPILYGALVTYGLLSLLVPLGALRGAKRR